MTQSAHMCRDRRRRRIQRRPNRCDSVRSCESSILGPHRRSCSTGLAIKPNSAVFWQPSNGKYVGLIEAGIVDATKVVRVALEDAVSVASTLVLNETTLSDVREPKKSSDAQDLEAN